MIARFAHLSVGRCTDVAEEYQPPFDVIFGSDIIYAEEAVPLLVNALNILSSPQSIVLIAHEGRSKDIDSRFEQLAQKYFTMEVPVHQLEIEERQ